MPESSAVSSPGPDVVFGDPRVIGREVAAALAAVHRFEDVDVVDLEQRDPDEAGVARPRRGARRNDNRDQDDERSPEPRAGHFTIDLTLHHHERRPTRGAGSAGVVPRALAS